MGESMTTPWDAEKEEPGFLAEVEAMGKRLGIKPHHLLAVMSVESMGFKPWARNPRTNATGLIQFMPSTAEGLGTSIDKLAKMTRLEQLPYVEKYLKEIRDREGMAGMNLDQLYGAVFGGTPHLKGNASDGDNTKNTMLGKMDEEMASWNLPSGIDRGEPFPSTGPTSGNSFGLQRKDRIGELYGKASKAFEEGGTVEELTKKLLELSGGDVEGLHKEVSGIAGMLSGSAYQTMTEPYLKKYYPSLGE
jgi:hypothetical protein